MKIGIIVAVLFSVLLTKANGDGTTTDEYNNKTIAEGNYEKEESGGEEYKPNISSSEEEKLMSLNHNLSRILEEKLEKYPNPKIRPNFYGQPVKVQVDFEIREILEISKDDSNMEMELTTVMELHWHDPNLKYQHTILANNKEIRVDSSAQEKIWTPPVSIMNGKDSFEHSSNLEEKVLVWFPNGDLIWRIEDVTTLSCSMSLENFPMDEQNCSILIGSPNYDDDEMTLTVHPHLHPSFSDSVESVELLGVRVSPCVKQDESEHFQRTVFSYEMLFRRHAGYYIMDTYLPTGLAVVTSWLSFWMPRDSASRRVSLGVTCVLTITTLFISSQASSPEVSYVKAIDIYMGVCFTLVFTTLLQATVVGYLVRKTRIRDALKGEKDKKGRNKKRRTFVRRVVSGGMLENELPKVVKFILRCDSWCRFIYPLVFLGFNVAYWTYYLCHSMFDAKAGWVDNFDNPAIV